ncbi:hypothetical protein J1TS3_41270 [Siminovitchia fordii]|uniref:Uncharacterized protein n=1 Tax=Siminovitchia fordii TaxID=254759 RepID=A0ABQ4KDM7_9BACI|nr:hypothetical protein J1TS3_41270 [Siminovitchia fordii]
MEVGVFGRVYFNFTENYVEILSSFTLFYKYAHFVPNGQNGRKKGLKNHIEVSVGIELVCGNTTE